LSAGRFEVGNFKHLLKVLFSNGKPFRFLLLSCKSGVGEGRSVKTFIEFCDEGLADYAVTLLRACMDVEVLKAEPPLRRYGELVELEMKDDYALPVCNLKERIQQNPIDGIIAALTVEGVDTAFEVIAVADPKAKNGIKDYTWRITGRKKDLSQMLLEVVLGVLDAMLGRSPPKPRKESEKELKLDPMVKVKVEAAERKLEGNLFRCSLKVYGGGETLNRVAEALPVQINGFRRFKTKKRVDAPIKMAKPSKHVVWNALTNLCWVIPILIILLSIYFNALNPLRLNALDVLVTVAALLSGVPFRVIFRKRKPIVLCDEELSLIVGLPTNVKRLPLELGSAIHTRGNLPKTRPRGCSGGETQLCSRPTN
jgi:hypothetical protein